MFERVLLARHISWDYYHTDLDPYFMFSGQVPIRQYLKNVCRFEFSKLAYILTGKENINLWEK